jgi:hypothetical protein
MKALIAVALAALAVAGCSSSTSHPAAGHTSAVSAPNPTIAPSSVAPSPSPSPTSTARLTKRQARRAYTEIADPSNRLLNAAGQDYTDRVPFVQYRRDERAYIASLLEAAAKLAAVRWPARVEPYIRAMISTDVQADIRCTQDQLRAHSYAQADSINLSSQDCTAAQNTSNADTIWSMLGLPSLEG